MFPGSGSGFVSSESIMKCWWCPRWWLNAETPQPALTAARMLARSVALAADHRRSAGGSGSFEDDAAVQIRGRKPNQRYRHGPLRQSTEVSDPAQLVLAKDFSACFTRALHSDHQIETPGVELSNWPKQLVGLAGLGEDLQLRLRASQPAEHERQAGQCEADDETCPDGGGQLDGREMPPRSREQVRQLLRRA